MRRRRAIEWILLVAPFGGLVISIVAQWSIFQPGNFSDTAGPVYITLGAHGIYTSKGLGVTWYGGLGLFIVSFATGVLWSSLERRKRP